MQARSDISVVVGLIDGRRRGQLAAALESLVTVVAVEDVPEAALRAAMELAPDVLVLDEDRDRTCTGGRCLRALLETPATRLVALVDADDDLAYETLLQGAFSILPADAPVDDVAAAVVAAARGESRILAGSAGRLLHDVQRSRDAVVDPIVRRVRLTDTEQEVLARLAEGRTPLEIAALHDVTARLVSLHTGYAVAKVHHHLQRVRTRDALTSAAPLL